MCEKNIGAYFERPCIAHAETFVLSKMGTAMSPNPAASVVVSIHEKCVRDHTIDAVHEHPHPWGMFMNEAELANEVSAWVADVAHDASDDFSWQATWCARHCRHCCV